MLFCRPRRCSCICKRLMAVGCPAGVLLAEGGGGPDTGVAPLLRLPDPQAADRDHEDGRKGINREPGVKSSPLLTPHSSHRETWLWLPAPTSGQPSARSKAPERRHLGLR